MKLSFRVAFIALLTAGAADARPVVVENLSSFASPDPAYVSDGRTTRFADQVAIDGDYAIATGTRRVDDPIVGPYNVRTAFLLQRSGTRWNLVRRLQEYAENPDVPVPVAVAMQNGIAAVQTVRTDFYELAAAGWVRTASFANRDGPGTSLTIDGGRVLSGEGQCSWNGRVYAKNAAGAWVVEGQLEGLARAAGCDDEFVGGPAAISGEWAIVHQRDAQDEPAPRTFIYNYFDGNWGLYGEAAPEEGVTTFGPLVTMRGTDVIVAGGVETGSLVYRETPFFGFHLVDRLQPLDSFMGAGIARGFARSADLVLQWNSSADRDVGVVNVFRQRDDERYEHVAILAARNGEPLGGSIAISGRRVLVGNGATGLVHYFELPTSLVSPEVIQDTFDVGNAEGWSRTAGSTFTVTQSGGTRVLRQAAVTGQARAVLDEADWTAQAIEADIRATQFGASDAGFGLATRWQGPTNFYDVVVRASGEVQLRRMASGTLRTLATAEFTPVVNRTYRLRLQSVGTQHRVYVDGQLLLDVDSTGPTHGRAVLVTDRAAANFDNVVVSPSPLTTLYASDFESGDAGPWTHSGNGFWMLWPAESTVYFQSSVAGDARASIGVPTDDQSVRVRARLDTFAAPNGTQERWFGVMARHVDESNYYHLALRSGNTLALRKVVNGSVTTLTTTTLTVTPRVWYALRLDAVGTRLRAYVNGTLLLEASDSSHPVGNAGPVMFRAAVDYDDFSVVQP
jgi:hypothetical protein